MVYAVNTVTISEFELVQIAMDSSQGDLPTVLYKVWLKMNVGCEGKGFWSTRSLMNHVQIR